MVYDMIYKSSLIERRYHNKQGTVNGMHYYDAFILAGIYVIIALLDFIIEMRFKQMKKTVKPWMRAIVIIPFVFSVWIVWDARTTKELRHYENILKADQITIMKEDNSETIDFSYDEFAAMWDLGQAPIYADEDDFTIVCQLEFRQTGDKSGISMSLCRLDNTNPYPDGVYFRFEGTDYCFLSDQFLYRDAFYRLNRDHAGKIIEAVMARIGIES